MLFGVFRVFLAVVKKGVKTMRNFYIFIFLSICSLVADAAETKKQVSWEQFYRRI